MNDSAQKTFSFISTLALSVIALQLIPFSKDKQISNHCREYYAMSKGKEIPILLNSKNPKLIQKVKVIGNKTGLKTEEHIHNYCHSFYLNQ